MENRERRNQAGLRTFVHICPGINSNQPRQEKRIGEEKQRKMDSDVMPLVLSASVFNKMSLWRESGPRASPAI